LAIHFLTRRCAAAIAIAAFSIMFLSATAWAQAIQHDAEHYVLLHQYQDHWAAEDKEIDQRLAEIRERNGENLRERGTWNEKTDSLVWFLGVSSSALPSPAA
jgi:hypothetical protein